MDVSNAIAPKSDQLDAVDLLGSPPRVFTITDVSEGNAEQPVNVMLAEFPRVWRPSKGMLRVLAHCYGKDTHAWVGHKVELYTDPEVMFGRDKVGGVRISRLTGIEKRTAVPMIVKKGQGGSWSVDPLPEPAPAAPESIEAQAAKAVAWFASKGTSQEQLEERVGKPIEAWEAADLDALRGFTPDGAS